MLATLLGVVLLLAGGFVAFWAMAGPSGPPADAQAIPVTIGIAVPEVNGSPVAQPLAPSVPVRIVIPAIAVDAPVTKLGLDPDGTVQVPPLDNHNLAGWYTGSVTPGAQGAAVMLGHVDSWSGGSVFFKIKDLKSGDKVDVIRANGSTAVFTVDGLQKAVKVTFPTSQVYGNPGYPALRLVTCGGPFDAATGSYLDNIIVYAHLTN
ncbi:MAG TPA: class F sortase [Trebonia sp.]